MRIGVNSLQDFLSFLIRRRWWVLIPFVALTCVIAIITKVLPKVYVSESLVLATPRDVPENFVMDLTSNSTQQRLRAIELTVLSRSNLTAILKNRADLLPEYRNLSFDEGVERLRKQINIKFNIERDSRTGAANLVSFAIRYQHKEPATAQLIAKELTDLFISEDRAARQLHVQGTTSFLQDELSKKDRDLELSDNVLKSLKSAYLYELPERLEGNQRDLDRLNDDKISNAASLERIANQKFNTEQLMLQVPEYIAVPTRPSAVSQRPKNADVEAFLRARSEYNNELILHPSEDFPSVAQAKLRMDRAKQRVPPDLLEEALNPKDEEPVTVEEEKKKNPAYVQLENTLRDLQTEQTIRLKHQKAIENSIAKIAGRVDRTPQIELLMSDAERENKDLRTQRDTLNSDLTKAELAKSLEARAQGSAFQVVDEANLPLDSEKPNKWAILGIGSLISLLLSIAFAFAVDLSRQRVWTQSEIEGFWGVPVMVDIPAIVSDSDQVVLRKKRMAFATCLVAGFALYSVFLYGVYLKQNFILRQLDPVLEKLVYRQ